MIKHYIFGLLLFVIGFLTSRIVTTVVVIYVGIEHPHFGRDVERDVWELRRYAYTAYPVIREREQYYHLYDSYPTYSERWKRHPGPGYVRGAKFPYYRTYNYRPRDFLQEPVHYVMDTRIGLGSLLYDSSTRAWWLYGFNYMKDYLDNFPELITPP